MKLGLSYAGNSFKNGSLAINYHLQDIKPKYIVIFPLNLVIATENGTNYSDLQQVTEPEV